MMMFLEIEKNNDWLTVLKGTLELTDMTGRLYAILHRPSDRKVIEQIATENKPIVTEHCDLFILKFVFLCCTVYWIH